MLIEVILLILLIIINGVFSASEIAFLSVNKIKLESNIKKKDKKAMKIKYLINEPSGFLATIQIGITLAGFLASAFASETFADYIVLHLAFLPISASILKHIIVIIVTIILSYFTLVFGELIPKKLAIAMPEKIAYFMVNIILLLMKITYPFVFILTKSTDIVCKLLKIKDKQEEALSEEELKSIVIDSMKKGKIEKGEKELIFNIFNFNDTEIKDIMTSSDKVASLNINSNIRDVIRLVRKYKYTRFPVFDESKEKVVGIFNVKDMIINYKVRTDFEIEKLMREPYFAYEDEKVDDVFKKMQDNAQAMAIIVSKNDNKFVGVATLEDAVEEIVGNISDEYDSNK